MRIALVFPESTFLIDPMVYPPLGLWYLAAHLEAQGHHCDYFDLSTDKLPRDGEYDQLWMSATSPQMHAVRAYGRRFSRYKKTATVLGGPAVWAQPDDYIGLGYDLLVSGEADYAEGVASILRQAEKHRGLHQSILMVAGVRSNMKHVLPPVRRWSYKYDARLEDRDGKEHATTTMFTSRGCPMACAFCESGRNGVIWDRLVRYEPMDVVEHQLREIADLGFTGIMFYDDILPLNKPRMLQLLERLRYYNFIWRCFIRTDVVSKQGGYEYLKQMSDGGLVEVLAGVESADNRIKGNIWKGTTIEQDTEVLKWCKDLGIKFKASFVLGLPGEDRESMERTREWILQYRPDRVDVNILIPFPGTPITTKQKEFDVYWTEEIPESYFYKGPRSESNALVGTSSLSPDEIADFRNTLIQEIEAAGIPY